MNEWVSRSVKVGVLSWAIRALLIIITGQRYSARSDWFLRGLDFP